MHLLPYTSIILTASAAYILPRALDPCMQDVQDIEAIQLDGPTDDGTAGIGAEFESPFFYFTNPACSVEDTNAARKQIVAQRTGRYWELTADSTGDQGKVNAEYILDGENIKVGSGDGATTGKAWADDLISWKPLGQTPPNVNIANSDCNPWKIAVSPRTDPSSLPWNPQITAPMPLEAVYSLMKDNQANSNNPANKNILTEAMTGQTPFLLSPHRILSYAKAASNTLRGDQRPKLFTVFMPRTEFITLFGIVKSKLPGHLFKLFDNLACYKTVGNQLVVDTDYCTGSLTAPVSNNRLAGLEYSNPATSPPTTVNIKNWITGIGSGTGVGTPPVDALSDFDRSIDTSIGGLATKMEKMYNSQRSVPLIEFRNLLDITTSGVEQFMNNVDSAIQALHKQFANPPTKRKRQAPSSCIRPFAAAATSSVSTTSTATPTSTVVAPVNPPSQPACVPTPTNSARDSHEPELEKAAAFFCSQHANSVVQNGPINVADTIMANGKTFDNAAPYAPSMGSQDDVYDISITSVPNCTPNGGYNLATPVANDQCADILHGAWKQCNNQGRGGSITAGCLVYSIATKF